MVNAVEKIKEGKGSREETWMSGKRIVLLDGLAREGVTEI